MTASTSDRSVKRGLWTAVATGLGAAVALVLCPHQERFVLQALTAVWCIILWFVGPQVPGSMWLRPAHINRRIRDEGYRSPLSVKLFTLVVLVLMIVTIWMQFTG
jgi:hypothetical protein